MPVSLIIATTALGIVWGWLRESALFALARPGVLGIGDVLSARRSDLILPEDAALGVDPVILKIKLQRRGAVRQGISGQGSIHSKVCLEMTCSGLFRQRHYGGNLRFCRLHLAWFKDLRMSRSTPRARFGRGGHVLATTYRRRRIRTAQREMALQPCP